MLTVEDENPVVRTLLLAHGVRMKGFEFRGAARAFPIPPALPAQPFPDTGEDFHRSGASMPREVKRRVRSRYGR